MNEHFEKGFEKTAGGLVSGLKHIGRTIKAGPQTIVRKVKGFLKKKGPVKPSIKGPAGGAAPASGAPATRAMMR